MNTIDMINIDFEKPIRSYVELVIKQAFYDLKIEDKFKDDVISRYYEVNDDFNDVDEQDKLRDFIEQLYENVKIDFEQTMAYEKTLQKTYEYLKCEIISIINKDYEELIKDYMPKKFYVRITKTYVCDLELYGQDKTEIENQIENEIDKYDFDYDDYDYSIEED